MQPSRVWPRDSSEEVFASRDICGQAMRKERASTLRKWTYLCFLGAFLLLGGGESPVVVGGGGVGGCSWLGGCRLIDRVLRRRIRIGGFVLLAFLLLTTDGRECAPFIQGVCFGHWGVGDFGGFFSFGSLFSFGSSFLLFLLLPLFLLELLPVDQLVWWKVSSRNVEAVLAAGR